jgi:hypothetical protein
LAKKLEMSILITSNIVSPNEIQATTKYQIQPISTIGTENKQACSLQLLNNQFSKEKIDKASILQTTW